jgi:hypothetical protein
VICVLLFASHEIVIVPAIFTIVSSVAFLVLLKWEVGVWWSLLLAPVTGVAVLALMVGYGYVGDLIERFRRKKPARLEEHNPPDEPSNGRDIKP